MQFKLPVVAAVAILGASVVSAQSCDLCPAAGCPAGTTCESLGMAIEPVLDLLNVVLGLLGISIQPGSLNNVTLCL
ncbi:hypothetical protein NLI96_g10327 [Meripilus lineatus]|uniref:Hydrophobin n=1 Tax=Meripilus lineatus TaxID=2056292 RepID=A0AAD5UW70_9APHY|nr:hypothetical protein NLI96_g10327 [Physisporinus lineatus]